MDDASKAYLANLNITEDRFKGTPNTGFFGTNHIYFRYDANGDIKVASIPLPVPSQDVNGNWTQTEFADAPQELRAPNYRRSKKGAYGDGVFSTPEPRAKYRSDGTVETPGWLPNNRWVDADGTIFQREYAAGEPGAAGATGGRDELLDLMNSAVKFAESIIGKG